jgi:hypothetical protein
MIFDDAGRRRDVKVPPCISHVRYRRRLLVNIEERILRAARRSAFQFR